MANDVKVVCKNVFKNSDTAALQKVFTMKWIELINQFEKVRALYPCELLNKRFCKVLS